MYMGNITVWINGNHAFCTQKFFPPSSSPLPPKFMQIIQSSKGRKVTFPQLFRSCCNVQACQLPLLHLSIRTIKHKTIFCGFRSPWTECVCMHWGNITCMLSLFLYCFPKYVLLVTWEVKYWVKQMFCLIQYGCSSVKNYFTASTVQTHESVMSDQPCNLAFWNEILLSLNCFSEE